ncbi:MAG: MATE family efflux transporter [Saprospiraceae bacterium]|nr:MATE family efflux transporter [Saprospiraceae bacterium]
MNKAIVLLAIPMILELSLESVFAVVDMFFVGKLGPSAIATVGLTEAVVTLIYSVAIGLSAAATAMVARRIGEKDHEGANTAAMQSITISIVVTIVISILGAIYAPDILRLMGASEEVIRDGHTFSRIMYGGSLVIVLLFLINGIYRGAGNAAMAMRSLWIASGINIVLCPILIYGLGSWEGFGLKGAAIATTIGRGTGVLYQCYHLFKGDGLIKIKWAGFKPDFAIIRGLINIAWPATFQFILASGSWIVLAKIVADEGGTTASAGYQIAIRNLVFFILPAWGLSNAAATLVGQNLGAQQPDRAEKSVMLTAKYNIIFMSFVTLLFVAFPSPIIRLFSNEPEVIQVGVQSLRIIGTGFIFYGIGMVMMQAFNGSGDTKTPTWVNAIGFWGFQIPLAIVLSKYFHMGAVGAFIAIPVSETAIAIACYILFKKGKWKETVV